jgi:hypothetical protein
MKKEQIVKEQLVQDALDHMAKPGFYEEACNARACGGNTLLGRLLAGEYKVPRQLAEQAVQEALAIEESDQERFAQLALQMFYDNPALAEDARKAFVRYQDMAGHSLVGGHLWVKHGGRLWTVERAVRRALAIYDTKTHRKCTYDAFTMRLRWDGD